MRYGSVLWSMTASSTTTLLTFSSKEGSCGSMGQDEVPKHSLEKYSRVQVNQVIFPYPECCASVAISLPRKGGGACPSGDLRPCNPASSAMYALAS